MHLSVSPVQRDLRGRFRCYVAKLIDWKPSVLEVDAKRSCKIEFIFQVGPVSIRTDLFLLSFTVFYDSISIIHICIVHPCMAIKG